MAESNQITNFQQQALDLVKKERPSILERIANLGWLFLGMVAASPGTHLLDDIELICFTIAGVGLIAIAVFNEATHRQKRSEAISAIHEATLEALRQQ